MGQAPTATTAMGQQLVFAFFALDHRLQQAPQKQVESHVSYLQFTATIHRESLVICSEQSFLMCWISARASCFDPGTSSCSKTCPKPQS